MDFIHELQTKLLDAHFLIVLGGDFNIVRRLSEKSNGNVNKLIMEAFNDFIEEA
jgi:hypothetical protein